MRWTPKPISCLLESCNELSLELSARVSMLRLARISAFRRIRVACGYAMLRGSGQKQHRWRLRSRAITNFLSVLHHSNDCRQLRPVLLRNEPQQRQPAACAIVQPAQQCDGTNAPKRCSPRATASRKRHKKRDILRRTAMHASHRRELLVPRERRRPVESQRASSYTPREFMAVQKRRFFV